MGDADTVMPGRYRHYKGKEYTVLGEARHSETEEEVVVYRPEYGERGWWVRPKSMFLETVHVNGIDVARFERVSEDAANNRDSGNHGATFSNLFAEVPGTLPEELMQTIVAGQGVRIERIVSWGQTSPADFWYDQDQHEWVLLLTGAARLRFEDAREVALHPGDFVNIAAHCKHRVDWTTPDQATIWLAVFYD